MQFDPEIHHRRSIRFPGRDYSEIGAYFVTVCAWEKESLFGEVVNGEMRLNEVGQIVAEEWSRSAEIRREIELEAWVVMPNHLHGIVMVIDPCRGDRRSPVLTWRSPASEPTVPFKEGRPPVAPTVRPRGPKPRSVSSFVAGFKSAATRRINQIRGAFGLPVWQRNYYEHIVRDEKELHRVRQYILDNPAQWALDQENPMAPTVRATGGRPHQSKET